MLLFSVVNGSTPASFAIRSAGERARNARDKRKAFCGSEKMQNFLPILASPFQWQSNDHCSL